MSEVNAPHGIENTFVSYNDEVWKNIEEDARQLLKKLEQRFGRVEISDMQEHGGSWCVRIQVPDNLGDPLPLAALGSSLKDAAERLWRVSTFF